LLAIKLYYSSKEGEKKLHYKEIVHSNKKNVINCLMSFEEKLNL